MYVWSVSMCVCVWVGGVLRARLRGASLIFTPHRGKSELCHDCFSHLSRSLPLLSPVCLSQVRNAERSLIKCFWITGMQMTVTAAAIDMHVVHSSAVCGF
jgi:hypothetical protein